MFQLIQSKIYSYVLMEKSIGLGSRKIERSIRKQNISATCMATTLIKADIILGSTQHLPTQ